MQSTKHFDVIVIGVGSMGAAACYYLAKRGCRVLGLEQFGITHERGSHAGQSRIIRKAYFEHPDYVPLLKAAYDNWNAFENEAAKTFYYRTGIVYFGKPEHPTLHGIKNSASRYNVKVSRISREENHRYFPAFNIPNNFETLYEPDAGFVTPEISIRSFTEQAIRFGAGILTNETVTQWSETGDHIAVTSDKGQYTCDKLVITSGSWSSKIIPQLSARLKVTQQMLAWINPRNPELFSLGNFPCWFIEDPELGMFYGFPILPFENFGGPIGLKIASHRPGKEFNPDDLQRHPTTTDEDLIRPILKKYLPDAGDEIITTKTCLYTYTDDEHFIIDHLPGYNRKVSIACGFSGHGFKFVPVIGEILADLALKGRTAYPIDFLSLARFIDRDAS